MWPPRRAEVLKSGNGGLGRFFAGPRFQRERRMKIATLIFVSALAAFSIATATPARETGPWVCKASNGQGVVTTGFMKDRGSAYQIALMECNVISHHRGHCRVISCRRH
jgi:hypothetical protein